MKLIIVDRSKFLTYQRLAEKFSDDLDVRVIWDRRKKQIRKRPVPHFPERRAERRSESLHSAQREHTTLDRTERRSRRTGASIYNGNASPGRVVPVIMA